MFISLFRSFILSYFQLPLPFLTSLRERYDYYLTPSLDRYKIYPSTCVKCLKSKCFLSFSIKFWLIANKKRNGFFSAIVLWIVKNDPFAFLSLTKIRNIFKNPKICHFK